MAYSRSYNYRLHVRCHDVIDNAKTTAPLWTVLSHYANMLKAKTIIKKYTQHIKLLSCSTTEKTESK
jgi:hypothetical protein